jgi:hypothetical protein
VIPMDFKSPSRGEGMQISDAATEVLARAYDAASRFNPDARVRIFRRKGEIETGFADAPQEGDVSLEHEGMILFVAADVGEGVLDTSLQHDHLVMRTE